MSSSPCASPTSKARSPSTRKLFGAEPAKRRPGYANFAIAEPPLKLVLLEGKPGEDDPHGPPRRRGRGHRRRSTAATDRLAGRRASPPLEENDTTCCYAVQDKVWVTGPGDEPWEVYTVTDDARADLEGTTSIQLSSVGGDGTCCATATDPDTATATATAAAARRTAAGR